MSYVINCGDVYREVCTYALRILKGATKKSKLVINIKTAMVLGLPIPPTLLVRADEVIE